MVRRNQKGQFAASEKAAVPSILVPSTVSGQQPEVVVEDTRAVAMPQGMSDILALISAPAEVEAKKAWIGMIRKAGSLRAFIATLLAVEQMAVLFRYLISQVRKDMEKIEELAKDLPVRQIRRQRLAQKLSAIVLGGGLEPEPVTKLLSEMRGRKALYSDGQYDGTSSSDERLEGIRIPYLRSKDGETRNRTWIVRDTGERMSRPWLAVYVKINDSMVPLADIIETIGRDISEASTKIGKILAVAAAHKVGGTEVPDWAAFKVLKQHQASLIVKVKEANAAYKTHTRALCVNMTQDGLWLTLRTGTLVTYSALIGERVVKSRVCPLCEGAGDNSCSLCKGTKSVTY